MGHMILPTITSLAQKKNISDALKIFMWSERFV